MNKKVEELKEALQFDAELTFHGILRHYQEILGIKTGDTLLDFDTELDALTDKCLEILDNQYNDKVYNDNEDEDVYLGGKVEDIVDCVHKGFSFEFAYIRPLDITVCFVFVDDDEYNDEHHPLPMRHLVDYGYGGCHAGGEVDNY